MSNGKKIRTIKEPLTKGEIVEMIAEDLDMYKVHVEAVLDKLAELGQGSIKRGGAGEFTIPGLVKVKKVERKASKKRAYRHPVTGEVGYRRPRPARKEVKAIALKPLVDSSKR